MTNSVKSKVGLPPGELVYIGDYPQNTLAVELIKYSKEAIDTTPNYEISDLDGLSVENQWLNFIGLNYTEEIENIGAKFEINALVLEDIANTNQRPKYELFDNYIFFAVKMYQVNSKELVEREHLSILLFKNLLISFQETQVDLFGSIRTHLSEKGSKVRGKKIDFLFARMIDTVVDNYMMVVEHFENDIEDIEEKLFSNHELVDLKLIHHARKDLRKFKRDVTALKEAIFQVLKDSENKLSKGVNAYLKDIYGHLLQIGDSIESNQDHLSNLLSTYDSQVNNKLNQIMKVLTIMSAIFIPITFVAGVYGMNFENMPELKSGNGYFFALGFMVLISIVMVGFFKRKKWL